MKCDVFNRVPLVFADPFVARHRRHWRTEPFFFDPFHDLPLLEHKPGGFNHARPPENSDLPVRFGIPCRRVEAELCGVGTREFIEVLRLPKRQSLPARWYALQHGLEIGATCADAILLILEFPQEQPVNVSCLGGGPHLKALKLPAMLSECT